MVSNAISDKWLINILCFHFCPIFFFNRNKYFIRSIIFHLEVSIIGIIRRVVNDFFDCGILDNRLEFETYLKRYGIELTAI